MKYDEDKLLRRLRGLTSTGRTTFAAACAQRLAPLYARYRTSPPSNEPNPVAAALAKLWDDALGQRISNEEISRLIDQLDRLVPDENTYEEWSESMAYVENAVAALSYALRCRLRDDPQHAVFAARHVYEAVDFYVQNRLGGAVYNKQIEEGILQHPLVQGEFQRQDRDLRDLEGGVDSQAILALRCRAAEEGLDLEIDEA